MKTMFGMNHVRPVRSTAFALALLLGATLGVQNATAGTIVVTTTADGGPDNPAPNSLRAALASAQDGDTIDVTGVTGTIVLMPGATLPAELVVDKSVTILGSDPANLTVDANGLSRVFHVTLGHTVVIEALTVANGDAPTGNGGGGILNDYSADLTVSRCVFNRNSANVGGGISNLGATATVKNSVFSGNSSSAGGAIYNYTSTTFSIIDSTLSTNVARTGGAIYSRGGGVLTVKNSTLSGNSVTFGGAGGVAQGGGIAIDEGTAVLANSTLSGNVADEGGGIYNFGVHVTVANSTFSGNSAHIGVNIYNRQSSSRLDVASSILKADGLLATNILNEGTVVSLGFNLSSDGGVQNISTGTGGLNANTDRLHTDPMLGPLADNGGPTLTHLPLPGSPAIDGGSSDALVPLGITTDQRGLARTVDDPAIPNAALSDGTDIGAVEVGGATPPPPVNHADLLVSLGVNKTSVKQGDQLTYTISVHNLGPDAAAGVVVTDTLSSGTTFVSAKANKGNFTAPSKNQTGVVTWTLGDLANGGAEDAQLVVTVIVKGKTTITNVATASTDSSDLNLANNTASITTSIAAGSGGKK